MKTKLSISILFCIIAVSTWAQTYKNTYTPSAQQEQEVIQSQQIMTTSAHGGTIYEPFSNTTPSEQSQIGASYSPAQAPSGPRRDKIGGPDANQGQEFPVGEPWIMLAFAAAFAGVMYVRQRRKTTMQGADKSGSLVR